MARCVEGPGYDCHKLGYDGCLALMSVFVASIGAVLASMAALQPEHAVRGWDLLLDGLAAGALTMALGVSEVVLISFRVRPVYRFMAEFAVLYASALLLALRVESTVNPEAPPESRVPAMSVVLYMVPIVFSAAFLFTSIFRTNLIERIPEIKARARQSKPGAGERG